MALSVARVVALSVLAGSLALGLAACAVPSQPAPPVPAAVPVTSVVSPPDWRPGDRWVFQLLTGTERTTKTVVIVEIKDVNRVRYYVARVAEIDNYFTQDLHWAALVRDSKVQARMVPPQPLFNWPLSVGRQWNHRATWEGPDERRQQTDSFAVVAAETVDVPAGRFPALKIVRQTDRREYDEYWYAPAVRWYVKWVGRRGEVQFEESLREYLPAPRLIPAK
jgi:hypothetical protein